MNPIFSVAVPGAVCTTCQGFGVLNSKRDIRDKPRANPSSKWTFVFCCCCDSGRSQLDVGLPQLGWPVAAGPAAGGRSQGCISLCCR